MEEKTPRRNYAIPFWITGALIVLVVAVVLPVFAWLVSGGIVAYAPISSQEFLYIGAGHIVIRDQDFDADYKLEDVRYLYLEGVDLTDEDREYFDYVFCVYGKATSAFNLQIAYTTNNQFTYEIYEAIEEDDPGDFLVQTDIVSHTTHDGTQNPPTYYYQATGAALSGTYLNSTTVDGKTIADSSKHTETYGSYANVNCFAEPLYWQTDNTVPSGLGQAGRGAFVKYFILRVHKGTKTVNDRETDVICIAAKSGTLPQP